MKNKEIIGIFIRYLVILIAGLGNLYVFYKIFTPVTLNLVDFLLNLFGSTILIENIIIFERVIIELIPACVAGAGYYLLFILSMSVKDIKIDKRIILILCSFAGLLVLNVLRILFLISINSFIYFEEIHALFWYGLSTIFVVLIWVSLVRIFKIKSIPVYSDFKFLIGLMRKSK